MEIPKTKELCQAERFCKGLKLLAEECNMSSISYTNLGSLEFFFGDGSSVAGLRACIEAGLFNKR